MTGNQQDLAKYLGVNKSSVCRAVKAGRIKPEADGVFDFGKCAAAWHGTAGGRADVAARWAQNRGASIPTGHLRHKNAPAAPFAQTPADLEGESGQGGQGGTGRAGPQAIRMHYENSAIKLEMALRRALRYERAAAGREAVGLGALLRAGIERVIDQTAPRLAAAGNELERRRIIEAEIKRLRWMIKRELPRAMRRMKETGAGQKVGAGGTAE